MAYVPFSQSVQGQMLDLTVLGCFNLKDTEWFSRQDPYVVIEYSGQKFRTRTDRDGGKNPSFNETFKLSLIEGLREMTATVWNSNTIERDYYIGSTKILLNKVIETGYDDTQWPLTDARTRKSSGTLKLILHYPGAKNKPGKPEGSSYPNAAPPAPGYYGQPAPAYGPAVPAYGPAHAPYGAAQPSHQPVPYPPSQAPAQPYAPVYQAPPPTAYPPAPGAYGAPPALYHSGSAPPYPTYPPASNAPPGYPPGGYPPYRHR